MNWSGGRQPKGRFPVSGVRYPSPEMRRPPSCYEGSMRKFTLLTCLIFAAAVPAFSAELVEKIVARVNDRLITASEFEKRFAVFISSPQAGNNPIEARKKMLSEMIDEKLLEERA